MGHHTDDRPARAPPARRAPSAPCRCRASGGLARPRARARRSRSARATASRASETSSSGVGPRTRIRASRSADAERDPFGDRRDAEHRRASLERGPADVRRTVPVSVGLDDRPELRRLEHAREHAGVVPDRCEVDRDERAGHVSRGRTGARRRRRRRRALPDARTARPARPCATAAAAAASTGSRPFARNAPRIAREHVARAGGGERRRAVVGDHGAPVGRAHDRVGTLEEDDGAEALGAFARSLEAVSAHPVRVAVEQPRELAGVRRQHERRRRARPARARRARRRRRRRAASRVREQLAHELARLVGAPEPRPDRDRLRALELRGERLERRRPTRSRASPARGRASRPRPGTHAGTASVTYPASARSAARALRTGADVVPGEPPTTSSAPVVNFESPSCLRGTRASSAGSARTACVGRRLEPDVGDHDLAGVRAPRRDDEADLPRVERHGEVGLDRGARDLTGRGVDPGRHIDRDDRAPTGVHALDRPRPRPVGARRGSRSRRARRRRRRRRSGRRSPPRRDLPRAASRAAIRPSPPFEPPPQTTAKRRASGKARSASWATAAPARSISSPAVSG